MKLLKLLKIGVIISSAISLIGSISGIVDTIWHGVYYNPFHLLLIPFGFFVGTIGICVGWKIHG